MVAGIQDFKSCGEVTVDHIQPHLVRCSILYHPVTGVGGPSFSCGFVITPVGILATIASPHEIEFGVTLPLLENDGRALNVELGDGIVQTRYSDGSDEQSFLLLNEDATIEEGEPILSTYGLLRPTRVSSADTVVRIFIYPRRAEDPDPDAVLKSFRVNEDGFDSILCSVRGNHYERGLAFGRSDPLPSDPDAGR